MPITESTATTLVIEQKPWLEAFVGIAFVAAGAWAFLGGERVFGGGFMIAGAVIVGAFANIVTSRFDRTTGRFTQVTKGLVRRKAVPHPLDQITSVRVQAGGSSADSPSRSYRVELVLKSRERVHVGSGGSSGKADKEQLAAEIRRFLNLNEAPQDPPGFGELVGAIFDAATGRTPGNNTPGNRSTPLRMATIADIPRMHAIRMAVHENRLSDPNRVTEGDYRRMIEQRGRGWVYESGGDIVGFGIVDLHDRSIWALFVSPDAEQQGVGSTLLKAMVDYAFAAGVSRLTLTTSPGTRAERFYRKAGWQQSGFTEDGELRFELSPAR